MLRKKVLFLFRPFSSHVIVSQKLRYWMSSRPMNRPNPPHSSERFLNPIAIFFNPIASGQFLNTELQPYMMIHKLYFHAKKWRFLNCILNHLFSLDDAKRYSSLPYSSFIILFRVHLHLFFVSRCLRRIISKIF